MPHVPDRHTEHDLELVAAYAAADLEGPERARAAQLVDACAACAELAADLRLLVLDAAALPTPRRTRDYRLTAEQAAALRPQGIRGVLATLAGARFRLAAPVGSSLAALGIAGLLVASVPGGLTATGGEDAAGAAGSERDTTLQMTSAAPSASAGNDAFAPAPSEAIGGTGPTQPEIAGGTPVPEGAERVEKLGHGTPAGPTPPSGLVGGSALLLAAGLVLLFARFLARRVAASGG